MPRSRAASRRVATLLLFSNENTPSAARSERSTNRVRFATRHESNSLPSRDDIPVGLMPPPTALPAGGREGGSSFATALSLLSSTHYVPRTRVTVRHTLFTRTPAAYVSRTCERKLVSLFLSLSSLPIPFSPARSLPAYTPEAPSRLPTAPDRVSRHRNT